MSFIRDVKKGLTLNGRLSWEDYVVELVWFLGKWTLIGACFALGVKVVG